MAANVNDRIRAIIGKSFKQGTPYHGLLKIGELLDENLGGDADDMRAALVYARDMLDNMAKFDGHDMPLLREVIVKVLGEPAPAVGSTFSDVLVISRSL